MKFSAVILAGGASRRMGQDKCWLEVQGQSLLMRQVALLQALQPVEIFISGQPGRDYSRTGCQVLLDRVPACGPVAGLEGALLAAGAAFLLTIPVDMPCLTPSILLKLTALCSQTAGVLPVVQGLIEPLVGFYPTSTAPLATRHLLEGRYAARDFAMACLRSGWVALFDVGLADRPCFANWNRPRDVRYTFPQLKR